MLKTLAPFDFSELAAVQTAFAECEILPLIQGWQSGLTGLPATAQLGWHNGCIWSLGTLTDADVFNDATADNQNTWEMGDVFEVFVRRFDSDAYTEAHVTPNGIRLHLKFPNRATIALARSGQLDGDTLKCDPDEIIAHAWRTEKGWVGLLGVPVEADHGEKIRVSVCRYDAHHDTNGEPDVASTSNHAVCDFHRPDDWPEYTVPIDFNR
ncbi:hypothetical protein [Armatimonas sp.]|uniref:hypothetical protein n=1 Tax=Armatimonas sp. TaxID=1872638 RepID=UPI00286B8258|nr:hypothetical protein [Armatimonas sp.]